MFTLTVIHLISSKLQVPEKPVTEPIVRLAEHESVQFPSVRWAKQGIEQCIKEECINMGKLA